MPKDRVNILNVEVSRYDLDETVALFSNAIENNQKLRVCVTPVNCVLWAYRDENLKRIYNSADLVTADGVPLLWASRLLGSSINGRVTGLDLLPEFSKISAEKGYRFFFLGAAEGVAVKLANHLKSLNPGLNVVGTYSPPFADQFSETENEKMIAMINKSEADMLWVSLTAPKQDYWISEHFDRLNVSIAIGVGAAFDVVAGNIKRSPKWMQKAGLEWLFRLIQEPRRLSKRYLVEAPQFIPLVVKQKWSTLRKRS